MRTRSVLAVAVAVVLTSCGGSSQSASETTVTSNSTVAINSNEQKLVQLRAAYAAAKSDTSDAWSLVTKFYNEIPQESPPSTSPPSTSPPSTSPPSTSPPSTSPAPTASFASQILLIVGRYPIETSCGISREIVSESKIANWNGHGDGGTRFVSEFLYRLSIPSRCVTTESLPFVNMPYMYIGGDGASIYPNQILGYQDILDTYIPPLIEGEKEYTRLYASGVDGDAAAGTEVQKKWIKLLLEFEVKFSERHESNRQKLAVELKSASALQSAREPSPEVTTAPSPEVTTAPSPVVTLPVATYASKVFAYCSGVVECKTAYSKWEQLKTIENLAFSSIVKFIRSIAPPRTSPPVTSAPRLSKPSGSCALESGTSVSNGKSFTNPDGGVYKCQNGNWIMTSQPSGGGNYQQPQEQQKTLVGRSCQSKFLYTSSFSGDHYAWTIWDEYSDGSRDIYRSGAGNNPPC